MLGRRLTDCDEVFSSTSTNSSSTAKIGNLEGDDAVLVLAILPFIAIFIVLVLLYVCLHRKYPDVFYVNPKTRGIGPEPPKGGAFAFICKIWSMSDDEFEKAGGLDGLVFMYLIRNLTRMFAGLGLQGILLGALYLIAYHDSSDADQALYPPGGLAKISLANVPFSVNDGTPGQWIAVIVSTIAGYTTTLWVCYCMRRGWLQVIARRVATLTKDAVLNARVVLVSNDALDEPFEKHDAEALWKEFYPGDALAVIMLRNTGQLRKLLRAHDKLTRKVEHLGNKDPDDRVGMPCKKKPVSVVLPQTRQKLFENDQEILVEHKKLDPDESGLNYLVLFRSFRAAQVAKQARMGSRGVRQVVAAPLPDDLNAGVLEPQMAKANLAKKSSGTVGFWLLFALYLLPVAGLSFLISLENNDALRSAVDAMPEQIRALIQGLLPGLALTIFLALLPTLCMMLAATQCFTHFSRVVSHAFKLLFMFNVTWNFVALSLGSSAFVIFGAVECIVKDVEGVLTTVGGQLAKNSTFFSIYIALQLLFSVPFSQGTLLVPIILNRVMRKVGLLRPDEFAPNPIKYHVVLSQLLFVVLIGVSYAVISPITILFAIVYCIVAFFLFARNTLYHFSRQWPGQGNLWPEAASQVVAVLYMAHILLFAIQIVLGSFFAALVIPMPVIVYYFDAHCNRVYLPRLSIVSLADALEADKEVARSEAELIEEFTQAYSQPEWELPKDLATEGDAPADGATRSAEHPTTEGEVPADGSTQSVEHPQSNAPQT